MLETVIVFLYKHEIFRVYITGDTYRPNTYRPNW